MVFRSALILCVSLTAAAAAMAGEIVISGKVKVLDGDTLRIDQTRIRLHAIDAVEHDQSCETEMGTQWSCGKWVTREARALFNGREARCVVRDIDRYGRSVATCDIDGDDIGHTLVRAGLAFAFHRYGTDYVEAEAEAARYDRGLHAMRVQTPSQHRVTRAKGRIPPDSACRIKGNISASGTRIYHMPGQRFYERTGIRPEKGERWFCTEAAARAAGWRRARS